MAILTECHSYLKSPIVELSVGTGEDITILHAHQLLLEKSPYLEEKISALAEGENVSRIRSSTHLKSQHNL